MEGFTGHACERLECMNNCNGNGKCLTIQNYASTSRSSNSSAFIYNKIWDAMKVMGCVCDIGFTGYDCSQRICPKGDDPLTTGQVNEVQLLKCTASTGTFVLYYK